MFREKARKLIRGPGGMDHWWVSDFSPSARTSDSQGVWNMGGCGSSLLTRHSWASSGCHPQNAVTWDWPLQAGVWVSQWGQKWRRHYFCFRSAVFCLLVCFSGSNLGSAIKLLTLLVISEKHFTTDVNYIPFSHLGFRFRLEQVLSPFGIWGYFISLCFLA